MLQYPPVDKNLDVEMGVYPVDFMLESIIKKGIKWFREDPKAPAAVFGHLRSPLLNDRYGNSKIEEISSYINKYEVKVVQSFTQAATKLPSISIQLLDGREDIGRAGLGDFQQNIDILSSNADLIGRDKVKYSPISDQVHIGIHTEETPDLAKYIYYLVVYILNVFKEEFQNNGLMLGTFSATDISRLNEYLPHHIYSRYINFSIESFASIDCGGVPIVDRILGVHVDDSDTNSDDDGDKGVTVNGG